MQSYREYLTEGKSWKHVAEKFEVVSGVSIVPGDVYYTNDSGALHRLDGPALKDIHGNDQWYIDGRYVSSYTVLSDKIKWSMLRANIEACLSVINQRGMNREQQEYICKNRPDLIGQIWNLDPKLASKYSHEVEISQVDL